jgi:hypothetical protein
MKKIIFPAIFGSLILFSCKKDYTCECKISTKQVVTDMDGLVSEPTITETTTTGTIKETKKEAESQCKANNGEVTQDMNAIFVTTKQTVTTNCNLK